MNFEDALDMLFQEAVGVNDTIWYSETETLRDVIIRMHNEYIKNTLQSAKPGQPSTAHSCPADAPIPPSSRHPGANDSKILEDMICPNWRICNTRSNCRYSIPHKQKYDCDSCCSNPCVVDSQSKCIKIPEMWLDKGLPKDKSDTKP